MKDPPVRKRRRVVEVKHHTIMAKKKPTDPEVESDPLTSPADRDWLAHQLVAAAYEEQQGPRGQGWLHNETLRPAITERAAFLRALIALLPSEE